MHSRHLFVSVLSMGDILQGAVFQVSLGNADVPQAVPGKVVNAKRRRAAKAGTKDPSQKLPKLPPGAPATELTVWTEAEMAAAVRHLQACDPSERAPPMRQALAAPCLLHCSESALPLSICALKRRSGVCNQDEQRHLP